jgi:hypothetical protein
MRPVKTTSNARRDEPEGTALLIPEYPFWFHEQIVHLSSFPERQNTHNNHRSLIEMKNKQN